MIRRPPRSTLSSSSAASDVYKRQVYILQEVCYRICLKYTITKTLSENFYIGSGQFQKSTGQLSVEKSQINISNIVKEIISQHNGRFNSFLLQFSDGFQNSDFETYK